MWRWFKRVRLKVLDENDITIEEKKEILKKGEPMEDVKPIEPAKPGIGVYKNNKQLAMNAVKDAAHDGPKAVFMSPKVPAVVPNHALVLQRITLTTIGTQGVRNDIISILTSRLHSTQYSCNAYYLVILYESI